MSRCESCPRYCAVDREAGERGYCGVGTEYRIGSADLHYWEEPCISGSRGSGAIFFSGCNMRCIFCQNRDISRAVCGEVYTESELISKMLELESRGAHNINLVTATPYSLMLARTLEKAKPRLSIPVVYNCGGYESRESLTALSGLVDIYLPDLKYYSVELSRAYSGVSDYFETALGAIEDMHRQVGTLTLDGEGIAQKGLIVRHLVLPSHRNDSKNLLTALSERLPANRITLSLMRQYTPDFADADAPKNLRRRVTSFEYDDVLSHAQALGFEGYSQGKESARKDFTPLFCK